jgi:hypothetical protein
LHKATDSRQPTVMCSRDQPVLITRNRKGFRIEGHRRSSFGTGGGVRIFLFIAFTTGAVSGDYQAAMRRLSQLSFRVEAWSVVGKAMTENNKLHTQ